VNLYFHIGLHKTASTLLQNEIFAQHSEINYLGKPFNDVLKEIMLSIIGLSNDDFKKKIPYLKNKFKQIHLSKDKVNIISEETYSGIFTAYNLELNNTFKRIKLIFEDEEREINIKLFYVIRNQVNLIPSRYSQDPDSFVKINIKWKKFQNLSKYFRIIENDENSKLEKKIIDSFKFFEIYQKLIKLFKEKNVKVFVYEKLTEDHKEYFKEIANYLNINTEEVFYLIKNKKINQSNKFKDFGYVKSNYFVSNINIGSFFKQKTRNKRIYKIIKKYFYFIIVIFNILIDRDNKIIFDDKTKKLVKAYYYEDNMQLEKQFKLNLKRYYYF
jgi:hypothetical protein